MYSSINDGYPHVEDDEGQRGLIEKRHLLPDDLVHPQDPCCERKGQGTTSCRVICTTCHTVHESTPIYMQNK